MSKQYYDSALTGAEIDKALKAVSDLVTQNNNGKILTIENGKFAAKKPAEIAGTAVLEALNVSANGDYYPEAGVDGYDEVHVSVPSYPEPTGTIQISSNGTVNVKDYASAEVSVPSGITAADEGKVVKNGALVAQTARATAITQNGTYDTTENNEVTVNVSGSSVVVQSLSVTQNGTYNPPSGVDGYAPVTVNVPVSGAEILYGDTAPTSADGNNGDTYVQYQNVGGIAVVVKVTGGYNGGAVIDISFDGSSVFTATASDTYNRNYDKTHADVDVSGETITIDVTPPPSNTGKLTIAVASSQDSKTLEISAAGQNTSYGYGNYSESFQLPISGSGVRQATALFIKKAGVWLGVGDVV